MSELQPAQTQDFALTPSRAELNTLVEMANNIIASRRAPVDCPTPQAVLMKMLYGREIGMSPMVALHELDDIENRWALNARSQVAMVRRRQLGDVRLIKTERDYAEIEAWRNDRPDEKHRFSLTIEDAHAAGMHLTKSGKRKTNWAKWPAEMLLARVTTRACKALFPELFLGCAYTPDELGADTDEDGRPIKLIESTATTTGITTKPAASITVEQAAESLANAAATAAGGGQASEASEPSAITREDMPDAPPAEPAQRADDDDQERRRLADQTKLIAQKLKLTREQFRAMVARFRADPSDAGETLEMPRLRRLHRYIGDLHSIRWAAQELNIPADKYAAAIQRRGVRRDLDLSEADAAQLAEKLLTQISPFKRGEFLTAAGLAPHYDTTAGNG